MKKPLCYAPFIGIYATSYNTFAPCCVSKKFKARNAKDFWNSDQLKQVRLQLLDQQWPDSCSYCYYKSIKKLDSDVSLWDRNYKSYPVDIDVNNGNETNNPLHLDYRPSNICNLKCRMCGPQSSSQIEAEVKANAELLQWYELENQSEDSFDSFLNFSKDCKIVKLKILGGEPTIDLKTLEFLEKIAYKNPILRFTTNGTNLNKRFRNIMSQYSDIQISFSVDAVNEAYEYIRTNANWIKTRKQIEHVFKENLATIYGFNIVLMPYNIFSIVELLEWFKHLYQKKYRFNLHFDNSDTPYNSLSVMLPEHLDQALEEIEFWIYQNKEMNNIKGFDQLVKTISQIKYNENDHQEFKKFNNALDNIRKTNLLSLDERFKYYI